MILLRNIAYRHVACAFIVFMLSFFVGCSNVTKSSNNKSNQSNMVEEKQEEMINNGDKVTSCPPWEQRTDRSTKKLICAQSGGSICTPDRAVCLDIPPRALDRDTEITLTIAGPEFSIPDKDQLFNGAELEPNGLTFNEPIKAIVRPVGANDLDNVSLLLADAPDQYEELDQIERNPGTGVITGELDHFSWLYPYLVNPTPPSVASPSLRLQGGPDVNNAIFVEVGNGDTVGFGLYVTRPPGATTGWVWTDGTISSDTLALQVNYPTAVAGQTAHATLTMIDPGPFPGVPSGPDARALWRNLVFGKIFQPMVITMHPSGPDGIGLYPTMTNWPRWELLPTGYPSGQVEAIIEYYDQNSTLIGSSTLVLSVARP